MGVEAVLGVWGTAIESIVGRRVKGVDRTPCKQQTPWKGHECTCVGYIFLGKVGGKKCVRDVVTLARGMRPPWNNMLTEP